MKAKLFFMIAATMAFSAAFAYEGAIQKFAVVERDNGTFKVLYESEKEGSVQMNIINWNGEVVLAKTIQNTRGFILPVNFKGMKPGVYTIELVDATGKFSKTIQYNKKTKVNTTAPVVHVTRLSSGNQYLLSVKGSKPEKLRIRVLDQAFNTVYRDTRLIDQAGIVFNLKDFTGVPTFKVITESGQQAVVTK
jgi:hypothetical protein